MVDPLLRALGQVTAPPWQAAFWLAASTCMHGRQAHAQMDAAPHDFTAPLPSWCACLPSAPLAHTTASYYTHTAHLLARLPCSHLLNRLWGNDLFMRYMQTGEFEWDPLPW